MKVVNKVRIHLTFSSPFTPDDPLSALSNSSTSFTTSYSSTLPFYVAVFVRGDERQLRSLRWQEMVVRLTSVCLLLQMVVEQSRSAEIWEMVMVVTGCRNSWLSISMDALARQVLVLVKRMML
jgi:hypothetical protein